MRLGLVVGTHGAVACRSRQRAAFSVAEGCFECGTHDAERGDEDEASLRYEGAGLQQQPCQPFRTFGVHLVECGFGGRLGGPGGMDDTVESTVMLSEVDRKIFKKLGCGLTCDPAHKP